MEHAVIGSEESRCFMMIEGGKKYTVADIEALPEGERAELIDGELFLMATPTWTHQEILSELHFQIKAYIKRKQGKCTVLPAPFAVFIKDDMQNYVEPDIVVICKKDRLDEKGYHGAPDWTVEIVSPSSRYMDYVRKPVLYKEAGVREYWIIDPAQKNVTVYDLEHNAKPVVHAFADRIKAGIYEDLFVDFTELA